MFITRFLAILLLFASGHHCLGWGFFAHKKINRYAVYLLPYEMVGLYKSHITYLEEAAVIPDKRRYAVKEEAPRHYIDLDEYDDFATGLPQDWESAVEKFSEDTLLAHGIVPWHIQTMKHRLTNAFKNKDHEKIIRYSAEIGHYIADAHVPLHTTKNYNGQLTNQVGIHGFWESRLPELFFDEYDLFLGKATYIENTQKAAWEAVYTSHAAVDSVLTLEKMLNDRFPSDKKYSFEERGNSTIKVYSQEYATEYRRMLNNMVEKRLRASIKLVASFWYTCWVDAGQPDLGNTKIPNLEAPSDTTFQPHTQCTH
ncbi:zinc dependent phospholipase C family protein [Cytophagaceae bacterium ABcell3]|nr:zinc dependent phospholipase C family protein [Cytophagaceae bacterium ABcell3]